MDGKMIRRMGPSSFARSAMEDRGICGFMGNYGKHGKDGRDDAGMS
jgi:hypothetical protein